MFGHPDNYIRADALVTPAHIVPEWYFLPFYAMLKAFPSKGAGALAMILSMLIMLTAPWMDNLISFGGFIIDPRFRPFFRIVFICLVIDMMMLGWLGSLAVSDVNQIWMQVGTALYFSFWIIFVPFFNFLESVIGKVFLLTKEN
jgi:quinol-cytochrome oxidoreductase complex cytochrome b subunit